MMQPFTRHTAVAAPLIKDDINTDQIAPILHLRGLKEDYRAMLFYRARRRDDGSDDPDFVLNKPQFRAAGILVTGQNFGAGSSRESAVWSMLANDIRVSVDLAASKISGPGGPDMPFEIPAADRTRLLEGLDDIGLTLKHVDEIASWERRAQAAQPWLQSSRDSRRPA